MKFLKWFGLFFVSMVITLVMGIFIGLRLEKFFYPNQSKEGYKEVPVKERDIVLNEHLDESVSEVVAVSGTEERINADTAYICIERDMLSGEEIPVCIQMPQMYLGMTRERFLESMKEYENTPPLEERERGLVSVEVRRFSAKEVEVLMNYKYVQPSESFYLIVFDDKIRVLLDDRETVYLETGIYAFDLPAELQQEVMKGMFVPDEETLYDFLESYTS